MERDCGKGALIPYAWDVIYCKDISPKETKLKGLEKEQALAEYQHLCNTLTDPCSDVRLYVRDKQGYCNCMKSWSHRNGQTTDRMDQLSS